MPSKILDSFLINPASSSEIEEEIDKLNPSKAVGPYSIPIYVLKLIKETISKPLQSIFNFSLINGIVPTTLSWLVSFLFLKKDLKSTSITIDQFLYYLYLIVYLKNLCTKDF